MANHRHLRDLESQLCWCWHWYLLRIWRDCGSFDSASEADRVQLAEEINTEAEGRTKEWAASGLAKFLDHLISKLEDSDPLIRQEAAINLAECPKDHRAVDVLMERLRSSDHTYHDRACAAWSLGRIGAKAKEVVPLLLHFIEELKDQPEAYQLRSFGAEAIENLTGEMDVLTKVAQHCIVDTAWECRMKGLFIFERLLKRQPGLRDGVLPLIAPLVTDEVEEIREHARQIIEGSLRISN